MGTDYAVPLMNVWRIPAVTCWQRYEGSLTSPMELPYQPGRISAGCHVDTTLSRGCSGMSRWYGKSSASRDRLADAGTAK